MHTVTPCRALLPDNCEVVGRTEVRTLDARVRGIISKNFNISAEKATVFYRVTKMGETYYSKKYERTKARNSYTIQFQNGKKQMFGYINYFLSFSTYNVAVITPLEKTEEFCYPSTISILRRCIVPVRVGSSVCVVPLSSVHRKCVCLSLPGKTYLAILPNNVHTD